MIIEDMTYAVVRKIRHLLHLSQPHPTVPDFALTPNLTKETKGEISRLFYEPSRHPVHKWVHYLEICENYFAAHKYTAVKMLEIGVNQGGSLDLWRRYFGSQATIFGIDINPACANVATPPNQVRIGSQDDASFLQSVIDEMGAPDIVLDDGSHVAKHQRASFEILFPLLKEGGIYMIEDLHTAYWPDDYDGGYRRPGTAIEYVKQMIDDMHAWYHDKPTMTPAKDQIGAIHVHDSIVVIEKRRRERPGHMIIGP